MDVDGVYWILFLSFSLLFRERSTDSVVVVVLHQSQDTHTHSHGPPQYICISLATRSLSCVDRAVPVCSRFCCWGMSILSIWCITCTSIIEISWWKKGKLRKTYLMQVSCAGKYNGTKNVGWAKKKCGPSGCCSNSLYRSFHESKI